MLLPFGNRVRIVVMVVLRNRLNLLSGIVLVKNMFAFGHNRVRLISVLVILVLWCVMFRLTFVTVRSNGHVSLAAVR